MRKLLFALGVMLLILGLMGFIITELIASNVPSYGETERGVVGPERPFELPLNHKRPIRGVVASNVEVTVKIDGEVVGSGFEVEFRVPPGEHILRIESSSAGNVVVRMRVEIPESWYMAASALVVSGVVVMLIAAVLSFIIK